MRSENRIIYYDDPTADDFAGTDIKARAIDESFPYIRRGIAFRICSFVLYYLFALPLVWLYERVILRVRFVNKGAMKPYRATPVFLYGNHTGYYDAFTPCLISAPRRNCTVVSPDAVSVKGLGCVVEMLGGIPIPTTYRAMRKFSDAIDHHHKTRNITVYPEAHIWPYYTGVRPFPDTSFAYAVKHGCPVFAFFTVYTEPRGFLSFLRKANMTVYVSDPILPDMALPPHEARRDLCRRVYSFMCDKATLSTLSVYKYVQRAAEEKTGAEDEKVEMLV